MSKKFDVVIGNPPYQEEAQGEGTRDTPIYHLFMDAAYEVGDEGRAHHAGALPVQRGLHAQGVEREDARGPAPDACRTTCPTATSCFPARTIKGGIAVTYRDADRDGRARSARSRSTPSSTRSCTRWSSRAAVSLETLGITSSRSYRYTDKMYEDHPEARALASGGQRSPGRTRTRSSSSRSSTTTTSPRTATSTSGARARSRSKRAYRWIRRDYITGPESFGKYKVAVPAANGSATRLRRACCRHPTVLEPERGGHADVHHHRLVRRPRPRRRRASSTSSRSSPERCSAS